MARACTVCHSYDRTQIDEDLLAGARIRDVAGQHALSKSAVHRHARKCLTRAFREGREERERTLRERLDALERRADRLLAGAEAAASRPGAEPAERRAAAHLVRETRACLELAARLAGQLQPAGVTINLMTSPEWLALRSRLLTALAGHPDARADVLRALEGAHAIRPVVN